MTFDAPAEEAQLRLFVGPRVEAFDLTDALEDRLEMLHALRTHTLGAQHQALGPAIL